MDGEESEKDRSYFLLIFLSFSFSPSFLLIHQQEVHFSFEMRTGSALVFPHDGTTDNVLHAGLQVSRGVKYVLRTDAIYESDVN